MTGTVGVTGDGNVLTATGAGVSLDLAGHATLNSSAVAVEAYGSATILGSGDAITARGYDAVTVSGTNDIVTADPAPTSNMANRMGQARRLQPHRFRRLVRRFFSIC